MTETSEFQMSEREVMRMRSLLDLVPESGDSLLDIGARDGFLASRLVGRFRRVVALDLEPPATADSRIQCVAGDVRKLDYEDSAFDTVVCSEVLEHIDAADLGRACREIVRVARRAIVIGVPFRQDLRCGETRCNACGRVNPPWGHVNSFDEDRLTGLFGEVKVARLALVGGHRMVTNALSARLLRFAGNPFGTYDQSEPCVYCGATLTPPPGRTLPQRVATRAGYVLERAQQAMTPLRPNWIHARFEKATTRQQSHP